MKTNMWKDHKDTAPEMELKDELAIPAVTNYYTRKRIYHWPAIPQGARLARPR
jgi:hypothetical protein